MTRVVGVGPRISLESFERLLRERGSPATAEARWSYEVVARYRVDPLFALAIFAHESRFGTVGLVAAYELRNPGATRSSRIGKGEPVDVPGRGQFWRYPSWTEGFRDLAFRLVDPTFVYAQRGLATVEEIVPVWAPATDGNVPTSYVSAVRRFMTEHGGAEMPRTGPARVAISAGHYNRDGGNPVEKTVTGPLALAYLRAFRALGADARLVNPHDLAKDEVRDFPGGLQDVAQVVVDWAREGWVADLYLETHTDSGPPRGVFGIYPDAPSDLDVDARDRVIPAMVRAIAEASGLPVRRTSDGDGLMSERNTGVGRQGYRLGIFLRTMPLRTTTTRLIIEHGAHTNEEDLAILRKPGMLDRIARAGARAALAALGFAVPAEERRDHSSVVQMGPHGKHLGHGFLAFWRELERVAPDLPLRVLGWPLTEEFDADGAVYQVFERGVLKWASDQPAPWDVHLALFDEAARVRAEAARRGLLPG